jgi:dTMP kinase
MIISGPSSNFRSIVMNKGKFVTLEGGEGVGKSTNLEFVRHFLERRGRKVIVTREPGGTRLGEQVRSILLADGAISPQTELLLLFAARAQHLSEVILPALAEGTWVVSDRFTDASYAYQGGGRGIDRNFIEMLEQRVQHPLQPDLTLLFDAPVEIGMMRAKKRGPSDRFEAETVAFFERVREAYLDRAGRFPQRIRIIDASHPLPVVQSEIAARLEALCRT